MTEQEIYDALTEIFNDVFDRPDITLSPELTAKDITGWDSNKQIEIIIFTEQRFGFKFRTLDLDNLNKVADLVNVIAQRSR